MAKKKTNEEKEKELSQKMKEAEEQVEKYLQEIHPKQMKLLEETKEERMSLGKRINEIEEEYNKIDYIQLLLFGLNEEQIKEIKNGNSVTINPKNKSKDYKEKTLSLLKDNFNKDFKKDIEKIEKSFKEVDEEQFAKIILSLFDDKLKNYKKEVDDIYLKLQKNTKKLNNLKNILETKAPIETYSTEEGTPIMAGFQKEPLGKELAEEFLTIHNQLIEGEITQGSYYLLTEKLNSFYNIIEKEVEDIKTQVAKREEEIDKAIEEAKEERMSLQEYKEKKKFKEIKAKTQAVVVYEPYSKIFLEGEELYKIFKEQAIVNINFGLTKENEKDVKYKLTQMNYEMSDDDEKIFNTCLSIEYNLENHQYPVDTLIEEDTMYQIYKGDVSFSKIPSSSERKEMKKKLLGIASNQGYMKFSKNYTFLDEEAQVKFEEEGTILPIVYRTIEIKKGGRVYKKKGYCFTRKIPLYMFFKELNQINTAPLEVEAILRNEKMYNEITRVLKKEIAQLYYFQNTKGEPRGFQKSMFYTEEKELLPISKLAEYKIEYKSQHKKEPFVIYASKSRRTIDSLIKECQIVIEEKGEDGKTIKRTLQAGTEKRLEGKKKSRFIEGVIDFLRKAKDIAYNEGNYIKDFIMYDEKGNIIENEDFITQKDKEEFKKHSKGKKPPTKKNPSVYSIEIIITNSNKKKIKQIATK